MANTIRMNFSITEEVSTLLHKQENMSDIVNNAILQFFNKKEDKETLDTRAKELMVSIEEHTSQLIDVSNRLGVIIEEGNKADREEAIRQKKELEEQLTRRKQGSIDSFKPFFLAIKQNMSFFDKCFGNGSLLQERAWEDLTGLALEMNQAKIHTLKYDAYILWKIGKLYDDLKHFEPEVEVQEVKYESWS